MVKVVLISHLGLPYKGIGSWTTRFSYIIAKKFQPIDYIICAEETLINPINSIKYLFADEPKYFKHKISKIIKHYQYLDYWKQLKKILSQEDKLIVKIIDNVKILQAIDFYSRKEGIRNRIKIIFFHHGYHYFLAPVELEKFYNMIDDLVLLTKSAYDYQIEQTHAISCEVTHIYSGINSKIFKRVSLDEKNFLKSKLGFKEDKIYFLWLSQDRPKKGLHIILKAWSELSRKYSNIELLVIGTRNEIKGKQIRSLGRIPNNQLAPYYQVSDFYLFSTLCHEGQSMSLPEAIKCGSVCIASNIDPIAEVMGEGRYGRMVDTPNTPKQWVDIISEEIEKYEQNNRVNPYLRHIPENIYDLDEWCENINKLVEKWKKYIS